MKILIVEDSQSIRTLMELNLKLFGFCYSATNGEEAVLAVKNAIEKNEHYDFICLDIMMPIMNGLEALKEIRKMEENADAAKSKIIMATGKYDASTISEASRNGCDGYFIKPVSKGAIELKLKEFGLIKEI